MNPAVLQRFIKLMLIAILVSGVFYLGYEHLTRPKSFHLRILG